MTNAVDELDLIPGPWLAAGLDDAMARLDRTLRQASADQGAVAFSVSMPLPERELRCALGTLGSDSVSFDVTSGDGSESKAARFLAQLLERSGATAYLETNVEGQLVAATTVGLAGDVRSALAATASAADLALHLRSLEQTLQTRRAWLRMLLSTWQAANKIALAAATGNPLLALPMAWKFIRSVMAEWEARTLAA